MMECLEVPKKQLLGGELVSWSFLCPLVLHVVGVLEGGGWGASYMDYKR